MTASSRGAPRVFTLVFDLLLAAFIVGATTATVSVAVATSTPQPCPVIFGVLTAVFALAAFPAFTILALSPPRPPLAQRSALLSSAVWFGRTVWSGAVFAASLVIGAVVGIAAARVSENEENLTTAFGAALAASSQLVLWPILLAVAIFAYAAMGIRWIVDLGAVVRSGDAIVAWLQVERRWLPPAKTVEPAWRDTIIDVIVFAGRVAIAFLLITVALAASVMISGLVATLGG